MRTVPLRRCAVLSRSSSASLARVPSAWHCRNAAICSSPQGRKPSPFLKRTVTPDDEDGRGFGKINDLAFGFGGGLGAWRRFDDSDRYSDGEIEHFKEEFRRMHPATVDFWHRLEQAAHRAVITGQKISSAKYRVAWEMENGTLLLTLPSGRRISYPEAKVVPGKFDGTYALRYKDNAKGRWADYDAWYGALVENARARHLGSRDAPDRGRRLSHRPHGS